MCRKTKEEKSTTVPTKPPARPPTVAELRKPTLCFGYSPHPSSATSWFKVVFGHQLKPPKAQRERMRIRYRHCLVPGVAPNEILLLHIRHFRQTFVYFREALAMKTLWSCYRTSSLCGECFDDSSYARATARVLWPSFTTSVLCSILQRPTLGICSTVHS